jgi:hypothetical protein
VTVPVGLNVAVTPAGNPEAARVTLPVKPFCGANVIVSVALLPGLTVTLAADAAKVKPGTTTARVMVVVLLTVPDVPATVMVDVPATAVLPAVNVSVLWVAVLAGLKDAVTPAGKPDTVSAAVAVTVMVLAAVLPGFMVIAAGEADNEKPVWVGTPLRSSMRCCPSGVPQPVTRS